jgi:uncharacterized protein YqhQ
LSKEEKLRLGGMALRNGLLVHGPTHWAAAVRNREGGIEVASGRKPDLGSRLTRRVPGARGVTKLAEAFAIVPIVKRRLPAAGLPMEDAKALGGMLLAAVLTRALRGERQRTLGREAAVSALGLAPALLVLRGGDIAAYHGVEHKAIAAYEQGGEAAEASKEHDRCGSNLVAPMVAANLAGAALMRRVLERPGPLANAAVSLGAVAAAVEVFAWAERHGDTRAARAIRRPGFELQRAMGTREPDERQLEVGRAALEEIVRVEGAA